MTVEQKPMTVGGSSIPTGLCNKVQGCEARATLGQSFDSLPTPTGLRRIDPAQPQPRWAVRVYRRLAAVAAAILAAVEGGILPPGMVTLNAELTPTPVRQSAGQDARLYGRPDARRYAKQPRWGCVSSRLFTQGSSCVATLGLEPESLWDTLGIFENASD